MRRVALILVAGLACDPRGPAPRSPTPKPIVGALRVDTIAKGLSSPWGFEFLPDGRMIVTERPGRVRIVDSLATSLPRSLVYRLCMRRGKVDCSTSRSIRRSRRITSSTCRSPNLVQMKRLEPPSPVPISPIRRSTTCE
jgi:glucose/arabinose dehydrogenase